MKINRFARVAAISATLLLALSGCSLLGIGGGNTATTDVDLVDTSWSGTDSVGDDTTFVFQSDGTVAVTYNDSSYDDPSDTWSVDGTAVTVTVFIDTDRGNAIYTGSVTGTTMQLSATEQLGDGSWTVTLTQD
jgi:hypothetical protein